MVNFVGGFVDSAKMAWEMRLQGRVVEQLKGFDKEVEPTGLLAFIAGHHKPTVPLPTWGEWLLATLLQPSPERRPTASQAAAALRRMLNIR